MGEPRKSTVPISSITVNLARLVREGQDDATVEEYARLDKEGVELPRIDVFKKEDSSPVEYILTDGDSRLEAWRKNKHADVKVNIFEGSAADALAAALASNAAHGRARSTADKRRAIKLALEQPQYARKSSREIGRLCGNVSHHLVEDVRAELGRKDEPRESKTGKKVSPKRQPAKPAKSSPLFDFEEITAEIDHVCAAVEHVVEIFPDEPKKADYRKVKGDAAELKAAWEKWTTRLAKAAG